MSNALHQIVRRALLLEGVTALSPDEKLKLSPDQKMAMLLYMARLLPKMYRDRNDALVLTKHNATNANANKIAPPPINTIPVIKSLINAT